MERLTKKEICGYTADCNKCPRKGNCYDSSECCEVLANQLGEYEDTGLSPENIEELKKNYWSAKKLLETALEDIVKCCNNCINDNTNNHCGSKTVCRDCFYKNWQWKHAKRLERLEVE